MTHTIRKLAAALVLVLLAPLAFAQGGVAPAMFTPFKKGGGLSSGATISGCTSSILYADASSLLKCDPAAVVNGSVSTAGRSILTIRDTILGDGTQNFFNSTGTFPGTLTGETSGAVLSFTPDNDAQIQNGLKVSFAGGITNTAAAFAGWFDNTGAGAVGQWGVVGNATGTPTASVGVGGFATQAGAARGYGGVFGAASSTAAFGIIAGANGSATSAMGAHISFTAPTSSSVQLPTGKAALVVDNAAIAANIFEARDNGTAVLTVADGGATTFTQDVTVSTNKLLSVGGGLGGLATYTIQTPDSLLMTTGAASNSAHLLENADAAAFDFNNGRCGTSACTSPALIIHSPDQVTTEYAQISTDTSGAAGFQSNFAEIRVGGTKTAITEGSAQAIVRFGIPTSTNVFGATVYYTVYDINGANYTSRAGQVRVQGGNSGGTATCTINAGQDTEAEDGSQIATSNAATLTYTWTNVVSTTNCNLSLNATSSQGTNTYGITWTAVVTGNSSSITVVGQ